MPKHTLPLDEIVPLYRANQSIRSLAARYGVSDQTLRRRLQEAGEPIRREMTVPMDEPIRLYQSGMAIGPIAERFGVSVGTMNRRLKQAGVVLRDRSDYPRPGTPRMAIDLDTVRLMASEGCSCREIAAVVGASEETVRDRMIELGIPRLPAKARMDRNYFWTGGRTVDKHGYVLVKSPGHPHATAAGYVREHRLVMERKLGRYLDPDEVVHHKDDDTSNNHPDNLELFASNADHLRETLAGKVPNWTPEGKARMGGRSRRPDAVDPAAASRPASGTDAGP